MEIKGAGGSGPGWRGACTLAVILLYLHSLLLHTEVSGTTTAGPPQPAAAGPPLRTEEGEWAGGQEGQGLFPLICPSLPPTAPPRPDGRQVGPLPAQRFQESLGP